MISKREVELESSEWPLVDYKIQTITGKSSLKIVSLYKYSHGEEASAKFTTDGVIQATDFDRDYIDRVARRNIPAEEVIICCGHINIHPLAKPNKVFSFLLCKLDLGKVGTTNQDISLADSILLQSQVGKDAFQYNFMLKDTRNYKVDYEVNFTLGNQKEFAENQFQCMNCQNKRARIYCATENINLCEDCSKEHHNRRIMSNHELQKLDKVNSLPLCKKHNQKYNQYCLKCQKYLCDACLQKDNTHSSKQHPVAQIPHIYEEKHNQNQAITSKLKERVEHLGRNIEIKREQVQLNYKQTKQFIDQIYQQSLKTLNQLFSEKVLLLKSQEIELKMTSDKLQWCSTFIKFQEKNLKPIYYFQSQQKFETDMQQLKLNDIQTIFSIKGDIAAEGQIFVASKEQLDRNTKKSAQSSRLNQEIVNNIIDQEKLHNRSEKGKPGFSVKQRTIYDYNSKAESPIQGELALMLENAKLNFFCLANQT